MGNETSLLAREASFQGIEIAVAFVSPTKG